MDPLYALALAAVSFINVFLLGVQTRNVAEGRYVPAFLTSLGITGAQFLFVRAAGEHGLLLVLLVSGLPGAVGIVAAIWAHKRLVGVA